MRISKARTLCSFWELGECLGGPARPGASAGCCWPVAAGRLLEGTCSSSPFMPHFQSALSGDPHTRLVDTVNLTLRQRETCFLFKTN